MKTRAILSIGAALALTATVQLGAQNAQENSGQPITVSGCLQRADARRVGVPSGVAATTGTDQFMLIDVRGSKSGPAGANDQSPAGGHGASAAPPTSGSSRAAEHPATKSSDPTTSGGIGPWYSVTGDLEGLRSRVGKRVEVTGTFDTAGSILGTSASVTDGPSGTIHATSIKVIDARCNQRAR